MVFYRLLFISLLVYTVFLYSESHAQSQQKTVIVSYGEDITAGRHVAKGRDYPSSLERGLHLKQHIDAKIYNEGKPGITSKDALKNINLVLRHNPQIVLLQFGYNDILNNELANTIYHNLVKVINELGRQRIRVILIGTDAPENYPIEYKKKIKGMYQYLSKKHRIPLYENLLEHIKDKPEYYDESGTMPNQRGYKKISENLVKYIQKVVYRK